jgi:hypothetical protein
MAFKPKHDLCAIKDNNQSRDVFGSFIDWIE